jgi:hypothetical protein
MIFLIVLLIWIFLPILILASLSPPGSYEPAMTEGLLSPRGESGARDALCGAQQCRRSNRRQADRSGCRARRVRGCRRIGPRSATLRR